MSTGVAVGVIVWVIVFVGVWVKVFVGVRVVVGVGVCVGQIIEPVYALIQSVQELYISSSLKLERFLVFDVWN